MVPTAVVWAYLHHFMTALSLFFIGRSWDNIAPICNTSLAVQCGVVANILEALDESLGLVTLNHKAVFFVREIYDPLFNVANTT